MHTLCQVCDCIRSLCSGVIGKSLKNDFTFNLNKDFILSAVEYLKFKIEACNSYTYSKPQKILIIYLIELCIVYFFLKSLKKISNQGKYPKIKIVKLIKKQQYTLKWQIDNKVYEFFFLLYNLIKYKNHQINNIKWCHIFKKKKKVHIASFFGWKPSLLG